MGGTGKVVIERMTKRKDTENKRTGGLLNKAKELSMMCEAETAVVIYSPGKKEPTTLWPKTEGVARAMESQYLASSENAKSFLITRNKKLEEKAQHLKMKNEDMKIQVLLTKLTDETLGIHEINEEDTEFLHSYIDCLKRQLIARMNYKTNIAKGGEFRLIIHQILQHMREEN